MTISAKTQGWHNNVMLNTGKDVSYGGVSHHVLNICALWKEGKRGVIEDIVMMLRAEERGIGYSCPMDSVEILKAKNFLSLAYPNRQILHEEAERISRAMLRDYMNDRKKGLKNPLPLGHIKYHEIEFMMKRLFK